MRATANTTLSLGLVNAPVQLFKATKKDDVSFNMCAPDGSPVEQVYRKKGTNEIVGTAKDCGKSYEGFQIDTDTLKAIDQEAKQEGGKDLKKLNIEKFIPLDAVPFNRVTGWYYVGSHPKDGDLGAFATIVNAMESMNKAAVVKWVPKTRQEMLVLYVQDGLLYAVSVAFAADVQEAPASVQSHRGVTVDPQMLDMAKMLINGYADDSGDVLDELADSAVEKRMALIEAAKKGEKIEVTQVEDEPTPGEDLMAKLRASVEAMKQTA